MCLSKEAVVFTNELISESGNFPLKLDLCG